MLTGGSAALLSAGASNEAGAQRSSKNDPTYAPSPAANGPNGRLPLIEPKDLTPLQSKLYTRLVNETGIHLEQAGVKFRNSRGELLGVFNILLYSPQISDVSLTLDHAQGRYESFDRRVRQVIALTVSCIFECDFLIHDQRILSIKAGISEPDVARLASTQDTIEKGSLTEKELLARRITFATLKDHKLSADLFRQATDSFGLTGLVDIQTLIGRFVTFASCLNAFEVPVLK